MKMLIVDDEKIIRMGIANGHDWQAEGFEQVFTAEDGEQALEIAAREKPDIVITDIRMVNMSGLDLARSLSERGYKTKVIIISGYGEFEYAQEAIRYGVVEYLLKPARIENILNAVRKARKIIEEEREREKKLRKFEKHLETNRSLIRNTRLSDLVMGNVTEPEEFREICSMFDIDLLGNSFAVGIFSIDCVENVGCWHGQEDYELIQYGILNILNELVQKFYHGIVFEDRSRQIVMIINFAGNGDEAGRKEEIAEFAETCRKSIELNLIITTTIGIGRCYAGFQALNQSYQEASKAVKYKVLIGKNSIVHIDDVEHMQRDIAYYPSDTEEKLLAAIETGDLKACEKYLEEFGEGIAKMDMESFPYIKSNCIGLLYVLSYKFAELKVVEEQQRLKKRKEWVDKLERAETLQDIRQYMTDIIYHEMNIIFEKRHLGSRGVITIAQKYVKEHLDGDTTLKRVAGMIHMSPNYFTYLFKQETGENFSEYVSRLKIEKAKALLKNKDLKTYEVAEKLGFQDSRYFSQFFKRYMQMTPSEYRKSEQ